MLSAFALCHPALNWIGLFPQRGSQQPPEFEELSPVSSNEGRVQCQPAPSAGPCVEGPVPP